MRPLLLLCVAALAFRIAGAQTAPVRVGLANGLVRYQPRQEPPAATRLAVKGARNEWVGFQVVVNGGPEGLRGVDVAAARLRGPRGAALPAPALYREHYVGVTRPTYRCKEPPGRWPDALIPLKRPVAARSGGAPRFPGAPFDVAPGENQPLYAEIHVPSDARPGDYRGMLTVAAAGRASTSLSITLTVWGFALPASPACRSNFGGFSRAVAEHHLTRGTPEARSLTRRYELALIEHRLMPGMPEGAVALACPDGTPDCARVEPVLREYFDTWHANSLQVPLPVSDPTGAGREKAIRYLRGYYQFLVSKGWGDYAYTYLIDEPNDEAAYKEVRELARLVHEAAPGLRFLCTEQPGPQEKAWGSLVGSVDIWCPLWALWDEPTVQARLKAGDRIWSYTALCQGKQETPFWELDFPLLNYRVASWQNWISGSTGLLYWTTSYWDKTPDPWMDPLTYNQYNGEGMLFYPGGPAGVDGPIASLRLKALRDGMQDYDYCAILAQSRGRQAAEAIVRKVARDWFDWDRKPDTLLAAREELARAITASKRSRSR